MADMVDDEIRNAPTTMDFSNPALRNRSQGEEDDDSRKRKRRSRFDERGGGGGGGGPDDGPPHGEFGGGPPPGFGAPPFRGGGRGGLLGGPPRGGGPPFRGGFHGGPPSQNDGPGGGPPPQDGGGGGGVHPGHVPQRGGFRGGFHPGAGRGGFFAGGPPRGGGFFGGPPGGGPPVGFGGGPPQMVPPPQMGGPPAQQQPVSQIDRLKKIANCPPEKQLWVETKAGDDKFYFYNAETRETIWDRPDAHSAVVVPQETLSELVAKEQQREQQEAMMRGGPPGGMRPPGFPPGGGGGLPPFFPGAPGPIPGLMGAAAVAAQSQDQAWQEFTAPDGRKYYFNAMTQENTWEKPAALREKEAQKAQFQLAAAKAAAAAAAAAAAQSGEKIEEPQLNFDILKQKSDPPPGQPKKGGGDSSRPVSSTPITGTPWCVVWTGDNKVFFFNPSTRTSVWERPPDLYNRSDVDALVTKPPEVKATAPNLQKPGSGDSHDDTESDEEEDETGGDEKGTQNGAPPSKKSKQDGAAKKDNAPTRNMLEKPIDPAVAAELEAQREREKQPLEDRLRQFKEMLADKKVSISSTFEKELSKIVFEPRYLLLSATERRAAFDAFCRERAEVEREEKKKRAKEAKVQFRALLEEAQLHGRSSFSSFSTKFGKDERFKLVDKSRDREEMFNDFVTALYKKEKEEKRLQKEKDRAAFLELLGEQPTLTRKSKWSSVKKTIDEDPRYKALDSSTREQIFKEHIEQLPEETASDAEEEEERQRRLKSNAEQEALARRAEEVAASMTDAQKERAKEQERQRRLEAETAFGTLLIDQVKSADADWSASKRTLRKDERWAAADLLDRDQKESLFRDHIRTLEKKRRDAVFVALDELEAIATATRWKEAKEAVLSDERIFTKLCSGSERRAERDFRDWLDEKATRRVKDFKELLTETKIITYKSQRMVTENEQHLKDILAVLEKDKRYHELNDVPRERERLLENYLYELDKRGPPPPPTAATKGED